MRLKLDLDDDDDEDDDRCQSTSVPLPARTASRLVRALVAAALAVLLALVGAQQLLPSLACWQSDSHLQTLDAQFAAIDSSVQLLRADTGLVTQRAKRFFKQCHNAQVASTALSHLVARADGQAFAHHAQRRLESHALAMKQAIALQGVRTRDANATSERLRALRPSLVRGGRKQQPPPITKAQMRQLQEIQRRQRELGESIASLAVESAIEASELWSAAEQAAHQQHVDAVLVESLRLLEKEIEAHNQRQASKRSAALFFYAFAACLAGGYLLLAVAARGQRKVTALESRSRSRSWSWSPIPTFMLEIRDLLRSAVVLRFDASGSHAYEELNRNDILQRIRKAEITSEAPVPPPLMKEKRSGAGVDQLGSFCDLQPVHMRDLRKLDSSFSAGSQETSIVLRKQAILVNADPIRAIVMRHSCLVLVPDGADSLLSLLTNGFRECARDKDSDTPFEFLALEAILDTLSRVFSDEFEEFAAEIGGMLDSLARVKIMTGELETLRVMKNAINAFETQVDSLRRALMSILDNEEDLRLLYVTKLYNEPSLIYELGSFDPEEVEILLEAYLKDIYSTRTKAMLLQHRIQATESLVTMKLDYGRNYLLALDLVFSLVGVGLGVGTLISGIFGMNLKIDVPNTTTSFWWVLVGIFLGSALIIWGGVIFFRRQGLTISA
ncbi:hypothetical protein PybrP1_004502 [[Pythium] brassicae (nom. inval.)]|nr:hypothetical protein PybrP1_004502 [[Pythium] brassicae (nom. inval.)]